MNMNKQEAIEKIEELKKYSCGTLVDDWISLGIDKALNVVKQLDEPEKPVVPQFVADWYEENKSTFEYSLAHLIYDYFKGEIEDDNLWLWFGYDFNFDKNKPIQTLINMHRFGYEVEKEKLYTVKFANEDFGKIYIGIFKRANKIGLSTLPMDNEYSKCYFTESELKELEFWDNPAFEVNEVKE